MSYFKNYNTLSRSVVFYRRTFKYFSNLDSSIHDTLRWLGNNSASIQFQRIHCVLRQVGFVFSLFSLFFLPSFFKSFFFPFLFFFLSFLLLLWKATRNMVWSQCARNPVWWRKEPREIPLNSQEHMLQLKNQRPKSPHISEGSERHEEDFQALNNCKIH